jgi:DNA adenine methylase
LMDTLYRGWRRHDPPPKNCHSVKELRQEALWMNY